VNAGIYVLAPEVFELIPQDSKLDMPELFHEIMRSGGKTSAFPVREYWTDIGSPADLRRANDDFERFFESCADDSSSDPAQT